MAVSTRSKRQSCARSQVVLHLITSPYFRSATVTPALLGDLASFLTASSNPALAASSGMAEFKATLMHVLEAICQVCVRSSARCVCALVYQVCVCARLPGVWWARLPGVCALVRGSASVWCVLGCAALSTSLRGGGKARCKVCAQHVAMPACCPLPIKRAARTLTYACLLPAREHTNNSIHVQPLARAQQTELVLQHHEAMLGQFLPALCATVSSPHESGDTRFFCLRMVSEVRAKSATTCS